MNRQNVGIYLVPLLFLSLVIVLFVPYGMCSKNKVSEGFQECNCADLSSKISKLEGDVMTYQNRAQEASSKCDNDKSQLQTQNSQERTKLVQETTKKEADLLKAEERARALMLDLDKCETSRRAIVTENEKLREDYKITLQALTRMTDNAQNCQVSLDKTTKALVTTNANFDQVKRECTQTSTNYNILSAKHKTLFQDCYSKSFYGFSGTNYNSSSYSEQIREMQKKCQEYGLETGSSSSAAKTSSSAGGAPAINELLMSSADGKYKIYQRMTRDDINKMILAIAQDAGLIKIEQDRLINILKSLSPVS